MSDTTNSESETNTDDPIVNEAHKRFKLCEKWESVARQRWAEDEKFANGDCENNYQWPTAIYNARTTGSAERPALTINKVRQHNLQIINDALQHKAGIKYRAVGDGATTKAAEVYEGIARHIQDVSNAQAAFGMAIGFQVRAGLGFTRIITDYEAQDTFDQEIYIKHVPDPQSCFLDPDSTEVDGSDARYGFIFVDRPRDEVERQYPELKDKLAANNSVDGADAGWLRDDHVREAEYYKVEEIEDELIGNDEGLTVLRSDTTPELVKQWEAEAAEKGSELKRRPVTRKRLRWYKIVGSSVVETKTPPGRTVPIIPWIGEQTVIEGQLDRKGHTRALKDAQRMLNYNRSAAVEFGALQSKSPWLAPARAIEGYETYWETANTENHSILPYNDVTDDGTVIAPPQRQDPPKSAPVFLEGAQAAEHDMMAASGQYEAELGAPGNEISGKAINERQRQGDRATYHFIDNQALSIRRHGAILLELIPEVYDTARVKRILGEDGSEDHVQLAPDAPDAHKVADDGVTMIFNPNVGRYAVVSDVGPDYATQRQEAWNAMVQIIKEAPELMPRIGDLLFRMADFPLADEIAERLKPGLPPAAQAAITQLQKQIQQGNRQLAEAMQALTEERLKNKAKDSDAVIKAYEADTKRLAVEKDMIPMDHAAMQALIHETVRQALQDNLGPAVIGASHGIALEDAGQSPPGATGAIPAPQPNVGQQAAQPGGM